MKVHNKSQCVFVICYFYYSFDIFLRSGGKWFQVEKYTFKKQTFNNLKVSIYFNQYELFYECSLTLISERGNVCYKLWLRSVFPFLWRPLISSEYAVMNCERTHGYYSIMSKYIRIISTNKHCVNPSCTKTNNGSTTRLQPPTCYDSDIHL